MSLWRDQRGVAAAEYALILAVLGGLFALASLGLGRAVASQMQIATYSPGGTRYVCTDRCQMEYEDYCAAVDASKAGLATFSPALPTSAKCTNGLAVS
jgi:Flp pilus assembly pilin Flp